MLRGVVKSLYVELAGGSVRVPGRPREGNVSFLIGTLPFDLWKGR